MNKIDFIKKINHFTQQGIPYLFLIDFEQEKPFVCKLSDLEKEPIFYSINGIGNMQKSIVKSKENFSVNPVSKTDYSKAFNYVKNQILIGNSYLTNLTFPTKIQTSQNLKEIIFRAKANYKLFFKNKFISFSPESFIKIKGNTIFTFPMKGTIDASITNAKEKLLNDAKETYEHNTIVDLMRNDLAMVAKNIQINRFRYLDTIRTQKGEILQVSSEIQGELPQNWKADFGNLLLKLLPAGSISGAPKPKTMEIIKQAENQKRGYYTGVFGVYDGEIIDSAVLIRYIEKVGKQIIYHSGGGITSKSNVDFEYDELLQKIYIPV